MNIYVGNLSPGTSESELRQAFTNFGDVGKISMDEHKRENNAYSFCFVEMPLNEHAAVAIVQLNGKEMGGNLLTVVESGIKI